MGLVLYGRVRRCGESSSKDTFCVVVVVVDDDDDAAVEAICCCDGLSEARVKEERGLVIVLEMGSAPPR